MQTRQGNFDLHNILVIPEGQIYRSAPECKDILPKA